MTNSLALAAVIHIPGNSPNQTSPHSQYGAIVAQADLIDLPPHRIFVMAFEATDVESAAGLYSVCCDSGVPPVLLISANAAVDGSAFVQYGISKLPVRGTVSPDDLMPQVAAACRSYLAEHNNQWPVPHRPPQMAEADEEDFHGASEGDVSLVSSGGVPSLGSAWQSIAHMAPADAVGLIDFFSPHRRHDPPPAPKGRHDPSPGHKGRH